MRTVIVGAGPTGLFTAIALARRGRDVVVVDRDPGPPTHGAWQRKGVMQFHHAHTFRGPVVEALRAEMPDVLDDLTAAGADVASAPDGRPAALLCRRTTFDRVLRHSAKGEPGCHAGHRSCRRAAERAADSPPVSRFTAARSPPVWSSTRRAGPAGSPARFARPPRAATAAPPTSPGNTGCARRRRTPPVNSPIGLVAEPSRLLGARVSARQPHSSRSRSPMTAPTSDCAGCATTASSRARCAPFRGCRTGSIPRVRSRSRRCCPAAGCTTATGDNSTARAGPCCPG